MTAYDNLLANANKVRFASIFPPDKIVLEDTYSQSLAGGGTTTTVTIPHNYGQKCFITLRWSVDGTNYYSAQAYTDASAPYTANGWCNDTNVYIYLENYSAGTVTFYIDYKLDSIT